MLVYLAAAYSNVQDKDLFMQKFMSFSAKYMLENEKEFVVSPLFNHYSFNLVPEIGTDWNFWEAYSKELLSKCDKILVLKNEDLELSSTGVQAELKFAKEHNIPVEFVQI